MSKERINPRVELKFSFWRKEGNMYCADPSEVWESIWAEGNPDQVIRIRMGYGYRYLEELLSGGLVNIWQASHVEMGITRAMDRARRA